MDGDITELIRHTHDVNSDDGDEYDDLREAPTQHN